MIIECTACHARYTIADALVPPQGARVRCKKCATVIAVRHPGTAATVSAPTASVLVPPSPEPAPSPATAPAPSPSSAASPAAALEPSPALRAALFEDQHEPAPVSLAPAPPPTSTIPTGTPLPEGLSPEDRQKHERARRLARVLASDVAIYNREKRERGMQDGNIVAVLGYEIKKSWETYKERVGVDFANATPYFRDALNEIVAEGKKIF